MGKNALEPLVLLANQLMEIYGKNSLKENWNTTMNIGQIQGGISVNQVCPEAIMKLDFRFPETNTFQKITKEVTNLAKKFSSNIEVKIASRTLPTFTDTNLAVVKDFINSMEKVYNKKIIISPAYGASDSSHFAEYNIPVLMMKPMGGEIHSANEWVSISSCLKFYDSLKLFLKRLESNYEQN